jgi:hypothetical protein
MVAENHHLHSTLASNARLTSCALQVWTRMRNHSARRTKTQPLVAVCVLDACGSSIDSELVSLWSFSMANVYLAVTAYSATCEYMMSTEA